MFGFHVFEYWVHDSVESVRFSSSRSTYIHDELFNTVTNSQLSTDIFVDGPQRTAVIDIRLAVTIVLEQFVAFSNNVSQLSTLSLKTYFHGILIP